jgi:hypothetical protein
MSDTGEDHLVLEDDSGAESSGKRYIKLNVHPGDAGLAGSILNLPKIDTSAWFPSVQIVNALLPQLNLIMPVIDSALRGFTNSWSESITGILGVFWEQHRQQWDELFAGIPKLFGRLLPPNWEEVKIPSVELLETILLDEGIPLAWVPSQELLIAILDAPDGAARRRIIGSRWRRMVSDCEASLAEVSSEDLQRHCVFASDIVRALRDGHQAAAQALAANLLDSIIRQNVDLTLKKTVTATGNKRIRIDLDDYRIKTAFTMAPIWRAYEEYWEHKGDPIPRMFGRHPSAHAVSRTQYSRVNAVIGLMLVTSVLRLLDDGIGRKLV